MSRHARILVVDDSEELREIFARLLRPLGHEVHESPDGAAALERLAAEPFDLVLLDLMMPELNGYQVLEQMHSDERLRHVPVVIVSAVEDVDSIVRCVELGADDYLFKPAHKVLLRARVQASLERKRLRDAERAMLESLRVERERSERLLLNILPAPIAERLKSGEHPIADSYASATVLFADIVDFTALSAHLTPSELVTFLNVAFSALDAVTDRHGLEKVKTIGDTFMVVGGAPTRRPDHASAVAALALDMLAELSRIRTPDEGPVRMRIGIHCGPLVAGVIGHAKLRYDMWGDTVNVASRMESYGLPGRIHVTEQVVEQAGGAFVFEPRGPIEVKTLGRIPTFFLVGRRD